jgi:hypothetical protein
MGARVDRWDIAADTRVGLLEWMLITLALLSFAQCESFCRHYCIGPPSCRSRDACPCHEWILPQRTDGPFRQHLEKPTQIQGDLIDAHSESRRRARFAGTYRRLNSRP